MFDIEFICLECDEYFEVNWDFLDDVKCPHCETVFETDYDTDYDDNVCGPWLIRKE